MLILLLINNHVRVDSCEDDIEVHSNVTYPEYMVCLRMKLLSTSCKI